MIFLVLSSCSVFQLMFHNSTQRYDWHSSWLLVISMFIITPTCFTYISLTALPRLIPNTWGEFHLHQLITLYAMIISITWYRIALVHHISNFPHLKNLMAPRIPNTTCISFAMYVTSFNTMTLSFSTLFHFHSLAKSLIVTHTSHNIVFTPSHNLQMSSYTNF